jgi:hypothetical protein
MFDSLGKAIPPAKNATRNRYKERNCKLHLQFETVSQVFSKNNWKIEDRASSQIGKVQANSILEGEIVSETDRGKTRTNRTAKSSPSVLILCGNQAGSGRF